VAFSADGGTVFSVSAVDEVVRRWDVSSGAERPGLRGHDRDVLGLAVSPEGRRLASVSSNGSVRVWDLESTESRELEGHRGTAALVAFSADGRSVVSAGEDGAVRVWSEDLPLEPAALRGWLKAKVGEQPEPCGALLGKGSFELPQSEDSK
jgi:WD40 repeat protein